MNAQPVLTFAHVAQAFGIASMFVLWPISGKYMGITGAWLSLIVCTISLVVCTVLAGGELLSASSPSLKAIAVVAFFCIFNGISTYLYSGRVMDPQVPTAAFMVTVIIAMVVMTVIFTLLLYQTLPTLRHTLGFLLAGVTIYLLK